MDDKELNNIDEYLTNCNDTSSFVEEGISESLEIISVMKPFRSSVVFCTVLTTDNTEEELSKVLSDMDVTLTEEEKQYRTYEK